jgi:chromosome segregation ATPase
MLHTLMAETPEAGLWEAARNYGLPGLVVSALIGWLVNRSLERQKGANEEKKDANAAYVKLSGISLESLKEQYLNSRTEIHELRGAHEADQTRLDNANEEIEDLKSQIVEDYLTIRPYQDLFDLLRARAVGGVITMRVEEIPARLNFDLDTPRKIFRRARSKIQTQKLPAPDSASP